LIALEDEIKRRFGDARETMSFNKTGDSDAAIKGQISRVLRAVTPEYLEHEMGIRPEAFAERYYPKLAKLGIPVYPPKNERPMMIEPSDARPSPAIYKEMENALYKAWECLGMGDWLTAEKWASQFDGLMKALTKAEQDFFFKHKNNLEMYNKVFGTLEHPVGEMPEELVYAFSVPGEVVDELERSFRERNIKFKAVSGYPEDKMTYYVPSGRLMEAEAIWKELMREFGHIK
jgi:hypothetical protein